MLSTKKLLRETVKKIENTFKTYSLPKQLHKESLRRDYGTFCKESDIPGLKDAYGTDHAFVRFLWITFFVVGSALTAYFIYADVSDYNENPTATKVIIFIILTSKTIDIVAINRDKGDF